LGGKNYLFELSSTFPLNMFDRYYAIAEFEGEFIIYPERKGYTFKRGFWR